MKEPTQTRLSTEIKEILSDHQEASDSNISTTELGGDRKRKSEEEHEGDC